MVVASTPRTFLRQFVTADASVMMAVFSDPDVMRFGPGPQSLEWVQAWVQRQNEKYDRLGFGLWAVVLRDCETVVGFCGLSRFEDINGRPEVEVGYRLAKQYWGRGLATEAATSVRDLAFQQFEIDRLIALIDPQNASSIRVAEKLGMTHTDNVTLPGYSHADRVYSLTRELFQQFV